MRLLVTRPEPEASELAGRLTALGHTVLIQPLLRIELAPELRGIATPAALAFTSANAVRAIATWNAAKRWRAVPVFAVGAATADAVRTAGFSQVTIATGDVAGLAAAIQSRFDPKLGTVLYPSARDRAGDLEGLLPGFSVATVEAYRAQAATRFDPAVVDAIRTAAIDGVLLFSRRTSEIFVGLAVAAGLVDGLRGTSLYALSPQVAEPLAALAPAPVCVAPHPDQTSLIGLLKPALAHPP